MKYGIGMTLILACLGAVSASCRTEKAMWIEVSEKGQRKVVIAITEAIVHALLDTRQVNVNFTDDEENSLVTRQMLSDVLEGREEYLTVKNKEGSEATIYLKTLAAPVDRNGGGTLILETYKGGSRTFRMALPELDMQATDDKGDESVELNLGWKPLLPFLARAGGAVYIHDLEDDSEVWVYVE